MTASDPFQNVERRPHTEGLFDSAEVRLANRNSGILLETLRHDVTPAGMHYLLNHFDVPYVPDDNWQRRDRRPRAQAGDALAGGHQGACRRARCA